MEPKRLREIAAEIAVYLKEFEADTKINAKRENGITPFWHAGAYHNGRYVGVIYVRYQGPTNLTRDQAERYLAWLDQGGKGKHGKAGIDVLDERRSAQPSGQKGRDERTGR